ncbi:PIN family toxin-antitoxin system, toxin component [Rhodococcus hoagii]|nr:PIN family toxin-antitoxin system, toxin component [Prescottella equi]NKR28522.1 PIN family toxin-antitoxin system, toxin component [Prescottella equi]
MKFFLDNNETPQILSVLAPVYHTHSFRTASEEGLNDVLDVPLFYELKARGFDAIITRDRNQLAIPDEKLALRDCGLHWIGHKEPTTEGISIITSLTAGYLSAFPHIISQIEGATRPLSFRVQAIPRELKQRVKVNPI